MDPVFDVCQPAPLLLGNHSGRFFKSDRFGDSLAADAGLGHLGDTDDFVEFPEIPEKTEMKKEGFMGPGCMGSRVYNPDSSSLLISSLSLDRSNP